MVPDTGPRWVTIRVVVPGQDVDLAAGLLWEAGVAGIEERQGGGGDIGGHVELRAGIPAEGVEDALAALDRRWVADVVAVDGDEWLDAWRPWARAWRAGARLVVVPAWLEPPDWAGTDDVVVRLDPGRAFGSGSHATTRLCLAELEQRLRPGDGVLDVGCGSGVLAVAAARLGARGVRAIDIDPEAVRATTTNAVANGVESVVRASVTPVAEAGTGYDVVVANIGTATLQAMAGTLAGAARPGGVVLLSGILAGQADDVVGAMTDAGAMAVGAAADGEWRALAFERPGSTDRGGGWRGGDERGS